LKVPRQCPPFLLREFYDLISEEVMWLEWGLCYEQGREVGALVHMIEINFNTYV
jgi:hypothetical protein